MAKILIVKPKTRSKFKIKVDGNLVPYIENGDMFEFEVDYGNHTIQIYNGYLKVAEKSININLAEVKLQMKSSEEYNKKINKVFVAMAIAFILEMMMTLFFYGFLKCLVAIFLIWTMLKNPMYELIN